MKRIKIDRESIAKLRNLREKTAVCDESGHTLGYFVPKKDLADAPTISKEEIERRLKEKNYSTAEVLAHLKKLEKP